MWGHQNHTVLELFILLSRMHHYQAMSVIKEHVDKKYHRLILEGEQNLNHLIRQITLQQHPSAANKNMVIPQTNFNANEKILNAAPQKSNRTLPPIVNIQAAMSKEDNESVQFNQQQFLKPKSPLSLVIVLLIRA